jgi:hypothetical protein
VKQRLAFHGLDRDEQATILETSARTVSMRAIALRQSVAAASGPWYCAAILTGRSVDEAHLVRREVLAAAAELQRFAELLESRAGDESTWADAKGPGSN